MGSPLNKTTVVTPGHPSDANLEKIRRLLLSETKDGAVLALSLLESLRATQADYAWIFDSKVIKAVLKTWDSETWAAVSRATLPHEQVFGRFRYWAEKAATWQKKRRKDRDVRFNGLTLAMIPAARVGFLATWAKADTSGKPFIDLVEIPAGAFMMGSPAHEADRADDENQVEVRLKKPFAIGRTVVTQGQWRAVMGTEPWRYDKFKPQRGDDFPAVCISWADAVLFCQTLTDLGHEMGWLTAEQSYRLPTEAEWEYACRAGTTTAYSFGDAPEKLDDYGWHDGNSDDELHEVGKKKPNAWGLFDMHGNVYEWCNDWYADRLAGGDDPTGPTIGDGRINRGGDYPDSATDCRSAARIAHPPWFDYYVFGFRLVRVE